MRDTEATLLGCAVHGVGKPERRNCNDTKWKVTDTAGRLECSLSIWPFVSTVYFCRFKANRVSFTHGDSVDTQLFSSS